MQTSSDVTEIEVSIVCVTFNHAPYIRKALDGFIMQKVNFAFEIIVHDDASTDGTADIVKEYEAKYPSLFRNIYETENQYSKPDGANFMVDNIIIPKIRGKYVASCEGDDYWIYPYKLQQQYDFMRNNPDYSICYHNTVFKDLKNNCMRLYYHDITEGEVSFEKALYNTAETCALFMRASYYVNFPNEFKSTSGRHTSLLIYFALQGKVHYLPEVMAVRVYWTQGSYNMNWNKNERNEAKKEFKAIRKNAAITAEDIKKREVLLKYPKFTKRVKALMRSFIPKSIAIKIKNWL